MENPCADQLKIALYKSASKTLTFTHYWAV
jgi:hypothetical protein